MRQYALEHASAGDLDDVIRVVDEFCYARSFMINVGDETGALLDDALRRAAPRLILEGWNVLLALSGVAEVTLWSSRLCDRRHQRWR